MSCRVLKDVTDQKGYCFTCKQLKSVYDFYWSGRNHEPIGFFFFFFFKACLKEKQKLRNTKRKANLLAQPMLLSDFKPLITIHVSGGCLVAVKLEDDNLPIKFDSVKVNLIDEDVNEEMGEEVETITSQHEFTWE